MKNNFIQLTQISIEDFMGILEEKISQVVEKANAEKQVSDKREFYTRKETADLLRVSLTTLYHWAKEGILIPKKIKSRVYYSYEEVQSKLQLNS